jgi:ribosomal protein S18 acetylase RimI-like enzyme
MTLIGFVTLSIWSDKIRKISMVICRLNESIWGVQELIELFRDLDDDFDPPFRTRIESFETFAQKLCRFGQIHVAYDDKEIFGAIGYYCNDHKTRKGYISYFGIRRPYRDRGIANDLLKACIEAVRSAGMRTLTVRADKSNARAVQFYKIHGFRVAYEAPADMVTEGKVFLELKL